MQNNDKRRRLHADTRRQALLDVALLIAQERGLHKLTRVSVAEKGDVSDALVGHYFGSSEGLIDTVVEYAEEVGNMRVLGQALATGHPVARALDPHRKDAIRAQVGV